MLKAFVKGIADAIRSKEGSSELISPMDFAQRIEALQVGEGGGTDGNAMMYFATKDGGPMGFVAEMALMGFAVILADGTITTSAYMYMKNDSTNELMLTIKAIAFVLEDFSSSGGADISNPDTLRGMMFQLNGMEDMPEIIEITKEQFYDLTT